MVIALTSLIVNILDWRQIGRDVHIEALQSHAYFVSLEQFVHKGLKVDRFLLQPHLSGLETGRLDQIGDHGIHPFGTGGDAFGALQFGARQARLLQRPAQKLGLSLNNGERVS